MTESEEGGELRDFEQGGSIGCHHMMEFEMAGAAVLEKRVYFRRIGRIMPESSLT